MFTCPTEAKGPRAGAVGREGALGWEGQAGQEEMIPWSEEQAGASPDDVIDDNWVRGQQQSCEALGNLRKLQPGTIKNLRQEEEVTLVLGKSETTVLDPSILERPQEARSI